MSGRGERYLYASGISSYAVTHCIEEPGESHLRILVGTVGIGKCCIIFLPASVQEMHTQLSP